MNKDELGSQDDALTSSWTVRWHDYVPAAALVLIMLLAWLIHANSGGMTSWGVSSAALMRKDYQTIPLHLFAHGAILHLLMNSLALLEIGGLVTARLGGLAKGWARFLATFALAGLSSMIFFLSFHPQGQVPMIGASGAIYGLIGLLLGIRLIEELEPVAFKNLSVALIWFVRDNLFFLTLLLVGSTLAGFAGGVAWEAHLGGFLTGLSVGPWLLPPLRKDADPNTATGSNQDSD